jgi:protein involved in polysaccharide export with SLBB domain
LCIGTVAWAQTSDETYRLSVGDTVTTFVLGEPDLNLELTVDGEGNVILPLIGELRVAGLTEKDVEKRLRERLADGYLVNPQVSVYITAYRKIFIEGEVNEPGAFPYRPGLTVRQAVALAGGFTDLAAKNRIYVISDSNATSERRKVMLNEAVSPGDIIVIDESFF